MEHARSRIKTIYGEGLLHCFSFGAHEEDNILAVESGDYKSTCLVRVQSACYTSEIFRSTDCDCHEQLHSSLRMIHESGGLVVYMICDGRGAGLLTKVKGLELGDEEGLDTWEAYQRLGSPVDPRSYGRVATVLSFFGITKVNLLTNNPRKIEGLQTAGFTVNRVPLEIEATADSSEYLRCKRDKFGHLLERLGDI